MTVEFGRNPNQIAHTFRHTDLQGLKRRAVRLAVIETLNALDRTLPYGPYTAQVQVEGVNLEVRAYQFSDGSIHVRRITVRRSGATSAHRR